MDILCTNIIYNNTPVLLLYAIPRSFISTRNTHNYIQHHISRYKWETEIVRRSTPSSLCIHLNLVSCNNTDKVFRSTHTDLSEELLQQGGGPAVVEVPAFGRVADVCCVQQQGQGFRFVDPAKEEIYGKWIHESLYRFVYFSLELQQLVDYKWWME